MEYRNKILCGDVIDKLKELPDKCVNTCVTSPPYWALRDYNIKGQIGLEKTPEEYIEKMVVVFREVWRVLRDDGTIWVNMGDTFLCQQGKGYPGYGGRNVPADPKVQKSCKRPKWLKPKNLIGLPWRLAFALQADGWTLRSDIIWHKPNPMPESVTDRPTKAHEYIFLLSKKAKYYYDANAIREDYSENSDMEYRKTLRVGKFYRAGNENPYKSNTPLAGDRKITPLANGRNKRSVWTVATQPYKEAHFATFPPKLIEPCILASCPSGGIVLDPFMGSGTTALVAKRLGHDFIGIELNPRDINLIEKRLAEVSLLMAETC